MMGLKKKAMGGHVRMTQAVLVLLAMAAALMLSSGVALAASITCQVVTKDEACFGTPEPDTIEGTAYKDTIYARAGNDILRGHGGDDSLYDQRGSDRLFGGPGEDYLNGGPGNDELNGGADYDYYYVLTNSWGKESIADSTASGSALSFYYYEGKGVTEDLTIRLLPGAGPEVKNASGTNTVNWQSDTHIEDVEGGAGDDTITGNFWGNTIYGGQGEDTISSGLGNDYIYVADGEKDKVDCGSGYWGHDYDYVYYNLSDEVSDNCEVKDLAP